jgi:fructan beta-fructosidase
MTDPTQTRNVSAFRPGYHYTPSRNWINDPNGLLWFDGEYHMFYQYNPAGDVWGEIGWGHAVSTDLLHWEELPVALEADDRYMIFSGSAIVDTNNTAGFAGPGETALVAIYTGARRIPQGLQNQQIAYSTDRGRTWTKYRHNPVLDLGMAEFRDPKVQWYAPGAHWLMTVVLPELHRVSFYASDDLKSWRHLSDFGPAGAIGGIWECPDLFPVRWKDGVAWVLKVDVFDGHVSGSTGGQYFVGDFDGVRFIPYPGQPPRWSDYGADFYAALSWNGLPEAMANPVWIGWMNNHRYAQVTPSHPWRGAMSQPRQLTLREDAHGLLLAQTPLPQLTSRRAGHQHQTGVKTGDTPREWPLDGNGKMQWEIRASFALDTGAHEFGLRLGNGAGEHTLVGYCAQSGAVFVDRSHSGLMADNPDFCGRRSAPVEPEPELLLHILVDNCSVEVFVNEGAAVITELVFPTAPADVLAMYAFGGKAHLLSIDIWQLA